MKDKIQISERQLIDIISIHTNVLIKHNFHETAEVIKKETIKRLREEGYIKKSKLEQARDYHKEVLKSYKYYNKLVAFNKLQEYYEQAVEEVQNERWYNKVSSWRKY